jgi:hypothetical protein
MEQCKASMWMVTSGHQEHGCLGIGFCRVADGICSGLQLLNIGTQNCWQNLCKIQLPSVSVFGLRARENKESKTLLGVSAESAQDSAPDAQLDVG